MNQENSCFKGMTHDQIFDAIKYGLHYLTTIDLVTLHKEISEVQIKRTHIQEEKQKELENG
tara:strand:- start:237 stop:419 length:183 start_codon:yes stop_codon:yes gene_type:complete